MGRQLKVGAVAFSPDGRMLAIGGVDKDTTIELWDLAGGKKAATLDGHGDNPYPLAFSPSGKIMASGELGKINLWDIATAKIVATCKEEAAKYVGFRSIAFSADGKFLASVAGEEEVELWDLRTGKGTILFHEEPRQGAALAGVAFSPDSETVAVAGSLQRQWIQLWSVVSGKKTITLAGHKPCGVECFAFMSDSKTIISVGGIHRDEVKVWDVVTGKNIATLGGLSEEKIIYGGSGRTFSPDGKMLALSMSDDKTILLFDVKTGKEAAK
jgi:WD40 repeat protein